MITKSIFDVKLYKDIDNNTLTKKEKNKMKYKVVNIETTDEDVFKEIYNYQMEGYGVVIEYPECIKDISKEIDFINDLLDYNCLFILNIDSLKGKNGSEAKKVAKKLIKNNIYNFVSRENYSNRTIKNELDKYKDFCEQVEVSTESLFNNYYSDFNGRKIKKSFLGL